MDTLKTVGEIVETTLRLPAGKLDVDLDFDNFGFDSIIAMELISNLSKIFAISLTPTHFSEVSTVRELADLLDQVLAEKNSTQMDSASSADSAVTAIPGADPVPPAGKADRKEQHLPDIASADPDQAAGSGADDLVSPSERKNGVAHGAKELVDLPRRLRIKTTEIPSVDADKIERAKQRVEYLYSLDLSDKTYTSIDELKSDLLSRHLPELSAKMAQSTAVAAEAEPIADVSALPEENELAERVSDTFTDMTPGIDATGGLTDVAIVGMACRFPDADSHEQFWMNLQSGKNSIREIPASRWDTEEHYSKTRQKDKSISKWAGLLSDHDCFDPELFGIKAREAALMDPQERLLLQEIYTAFQDANINVQSVAGTEVGVFVGYEYNEYEHALRRHGVEMEEGMPFSSSSPSYFLANRASFIFDFQGPSESINTNCASSAVALNRAFQSLGSAECSLAVAGGVCLNLFADDYVAASQYGILSADGSCGVFDDNASGFTRGEGVGVVLLKRLSDARRDNDKIYAIIKSSHQNNRGKAGFISEIKHESVTGILKKTHQKAGLESNAVDYIEVDGYCTQWGDSFEFEGIKNSFDTTGSVVKSCALGSVKGNIGHLEPASAIASVIKVASSLYHGEFPETTTTRSVNRFIDFDSEDHPLYLANKRVSFNSIRRDDGVPIRAGVNSFADSGANVHILLEENMESTQHFSSVKDADNELFVLSAVDQDKLLEMVQLYIDYLNDDEMDWSFTEICHTLQMGRDEQSERVAIIANTFDSLIDKLELVKENADKPKKGIEKKGIYLSSGSGTGEHPLLQLYTKRLEDGVEQQEWEQIALLWVNGVSIPWHVHWSDRPYRKADLPRYPFSRKRYWFDIIPQLEQEEEQARAAVRKSASVVESEFDHRFEHYAPPATKIQTTLVGIWSELLGQDLDNIGIHDDFFDRGGNSQLVVSLVNRIGVELGIQIPLTALLSASTISSLAELVESGEVSSSGVLVCLQESGGNPPLYAVPGAGGGVVSFQPLSRLMGGDQPFYGLQPEGHADGQGKDQGKSINVEAVAEANIESITDFGCDNLVTVLGYSNGGTVAFEMCSQLIKKGCNIKSLILIDSLAPEPRPDTEVDEIVKVCKNVAKLAGKQISLDVSKLKDLNDEERGLYLYQVMNGNGVDMTEKQFMGFYRVALRSERLTRSYVPTRISKEFPVFLFRALDGYKDISEDHGWKKLLAGQIHINSIEADHLSIMHDGPLAKIVDILKLAEEKKSATRKKVETSDRKKSDVRSGSSETKKNAVSKSKKSSSSVPSGSRKKRTARRGATA